MRPTTPEEQARSRALGRRRRGPGTASSPQSGLGADLPQVVQRLLTDGDSLCLGSDFNDLLEEKHCDQQ